MEGYDYDAAASTIKIHDITSDETNREILRRLAENDQNFTQLWVTNDRQASIRYYPVGALEIEWLGYFIGKSVNLKELGFYLQPFDGNNNAIETLFFRGVNRNRSIQEIKFNTVDLSGEIFQSLGAFFENNRNLSKLELEDCEFGAGCARQFSLSLSACNKSLKCIGMEDIGLGDGQLVDIFEAMSVHPQLEQLRLDNMNIGRNECAALANILSSTNLQELNLRNNAIADEGTDVLMMTCAARANSNLIDLDLENNGITARGCRSLAIILGCTTSNLKILDLRNNSVGDEGAHLLANALTSNRKLKILNLDGNDITDEGWSCFSKVLCVTSSVNNTFLSNHTLETLGCETNKPPDVEGLLDLNGSSENKKQVAIKKILKHHHHFDMQPFFEWDLKVLPFAVNWFERAQSVQNNDEVEVGKHKLGAIYQFIRAMPEVFEPAPAAAGEKRKWGSLINGKK